MSDEPKVDFQALAKEAAETVYNPRANWRCWFVHDWTMWEVTEREQGRRCLRCGRIQREPIGHVHTWKTDQTKDLVESRHAIPHGTLYLQSCPCGEVRSQRL